MLEPLFPWYVSHARLAGATVVPVRLQPPEFAYPLADLAAAFTPRTKLFVFNSPHNPTGRVATPAEVAVVAALCCAHNVVALADEVYERKAFRGAPESRLADAPGMRGRTLTFGTASKLLSLTGWRVGWCTGPAALVAGVRALHAYTTYCAPTPLQAGVAAALRRAAGGGGGPPGGADASAAAMERSAAVLGAALESVGLTVFSPEGGYFIVVDVSATGLGAAAYCRALIAAARVAAVPMDVFYAGPDPPGSLVRFAICKSDAVIAAAAHAIRLNPVPLLAAGAPPTPGA